MRLSRALWGLLMLAVASVAVADLPPEPALTSTYLVEENLDHIYDLLPAREIEQPVRLKEKGARVFRKTQRNVTIDDRWDPVKPEGNAILCERKMYGANPAYPPVNKYECRRVTAVRVSLPAKDEALWNLSPAAPASHE